jgi:hypothetical protein
VAPFSIPRPMTRILAFVHGGGLFFKDDPDHLASMASRNGLSDLRSRTKR